MTTLALPQLDLKQFRSLGLMHSPGEDIFAAPSLKRCHSDDFSASEARCHSNERCHGGSERKKARCHGDGDLGPEELISLSYELLTQIQKHEQYEGDVASYRSGSDGVSEVSSLDDPTTAVSVSTVLSALADSSSLPYGADGGGHQCLDGCEETASVSSVSSGDSSVYPYKEISKCDSLTGKTKPSSAIMKPLYTAELQVLCRICGDRASGYHYGVHSCEGCKGFFRRTLKKGLVYKPCRESAQCRIDSGTRNKCQYCRYQKCLNAGMSQNAVRFGRMPKAEREKLLADKEELNNTCSSRIMELRALSDCIKGAFQESFSQCKNVLDYLTCVPKNGVQVKIEPELRFSSDTIDAGDFREHHMFESFQDVIVPLIEGAVKFTKKIPSFSALAMMDRITLLKQNCFCVPLILSYVLCEHSTLVLEGRHSSVSVTNAGGNFRCWEAQCLFEGIFNLSRKLVNMQLKLVEVALYCAVVILIESPGISNYAEIEALQMELLNSLRLELKHNHPKDKYLFPRLLVLIPQLVQISEEFRTNLKGKVFDSSNDCCSTHELICELFELL